MDNIFSLDACSGSMCHRQILPLLKFRRHGYKDTNDNDIYIDGGGRKVGDRDTRKEGDKCKDKCGDKRKNKYRDRVRDRDIESNLVIVTQLTIPYQ